MIDEYIYIKKAAAEDDPEKRRDYLMKFIRATQDPDGAEAASDWTTEDQTSEDKIIELLEAILEVLHEIDQKLEGRVNNG